MEKVHANIQNLENKLMLLKEIFGQQKILIEKLQQENKQLKNEILLQKKQADVITSDKEKIKSRLQETSYTPHSYAQQPIAYYIQQIDACIDFLEKIK